MSWYTLALASALFLGLYELAKKSAIRDNSIGAVLFWSVATGATPWLPLVICAYLSPSSLTAIHLDHLAKLPLAHHLMLLTKSLLVGSSWVFTYAALRQLPISIAAPIRATSPMWTILVATLVWDERPSARQWGGIGVIFVSFYAITCVGRWEGIDFRRNRHVGYMLVATLLASASALYDKFLLQSQAMDAATVQAWSSLYLVPIALPGFLYHRFGPEANKRRMQWRWSIPAIGLLLLVTDFLYFSAVHQPGAMISLISPLRRTSVLVSMIAGAHLFQESNLLPKLACVTGLLTGILLVSLS